MRCLGYSDPVFENSFSRVKILRLAIHDVPSGFFVPDPAVRSENR